MAPGLPAAAEAAADRAGRVARPRREVLEPAVLGERREELEALAVGGAPDPGRSRSGRGRRGFAAVAGCGRRGGCRRARDRLRSRARVCNRRALRRPASPARSSGRAQGRSSPRRREGDSGRSRRDGCGRRCRARPGPRRASTRAPRGGAAGCGRTSAQKKPATARRCSRSGSDSDGVRRAGAASRGRAFAVRNQSASPVPRRPAAG